MNTQRFVVLQRALFTSMSVRRSVACFADLLGLVLDSVLFLVVTM